MVSSMMTLTQLRLVFDDAKESIQGFRIWTYFAWMEIKQRYRRSLLGPWWISISMLIFIVAMGVVYSRLFHENMAVYIPFFAASILFWFFISSTIIEACDVFKMNQAYIKQIKLPYHIYIFKHLMRQVILFLHNFIVLILIMIYMHIYPTFYTLLVIPGLLLLLANLYWIVVIVGLLSTRYRDMVPIVTSCMQIAFFITPVTWMPKLLNPHSFIMKLNPFVYLIEVVRTPMMGNAPLSRFWYVDCGTALAGIVVALLLLAFYRKRIPFWIE